MTSLSTIFRVATFWTWSVGSLIGVASAEISGYPQNIQSFDPREIAMLPRYCVYADTFNLTVPGGENVVEKKRWADKIGEGFVAIHHYCYGLMHTNRALVLAHHDQDRHWHLSQSIPEFDYVIRRVKPNFVLLPEILTRKGDNLIRLGKPVEGIIALQRAIELKPDYWPPYEILGEKLRSSGDRVKARQILEEGLSYSPDAKALKRKLAELDD